MGETFRPYKEGVHLQYVNAYSKGQADPDYQRLDRGVLMYLEFREFSLR
jgi:hypothetical protein